MTQEKIDNWISKSIEMGATGVFALPKSYLSYSSIHMLMTNEKDWIEQYINGNKKDLSYIKAIEKGREVAELRETDLVYSNKYPSLPVKEKNINVPIRITGTEETACLYVKIDCASEDLTVLQDDKTQSVYAKSQWDRKKVWNALQFRLYCLAIYERDGFIPQFRCCVIDTVDNEETGLFTMFSVQYTPKEMEETREVFSKAVVKAHKLICTHTPTELL